MMTVVKWLELNFLQSGSLYYAELLLKKYLRILRTRGKKEAIRFCKERRGQIYQWLTTIESLEKDVRIKSKVGLPKDLRFLKHIKNLNYPSIRLILSSLYGSRGLELPVEINTNSITSPPIKEYTDISIYVNDFWKTLGYRHKQAGVPKAVHWKSYHLSTKSGPNGQALWSSVADLSVLPETLKQAIKIIGGSKLASRMDALEGSLPFLLPYFNKEGKYFRKVVPIPDVEGKTREIAILDYWSQTSLRGLHQYLFGCLRKIYQDCTFAQGSFYDKINQFPQEGLFYSVDLTTATDRFPIELISQVLKGRFTDEYVKAWHTIMVGFPFATEQGKKFISYSVGNPMGAYSSWNSFAVAHHYVVYYCCRELGINWESAPYVLLGDDIVIKHDKLAKKYMEVMSLLGVEFSLQKSHISPNMFEFAKRTFHTGVEITPFPIAALWQTRRTPSLMFNVLVNETCKGWNSPSGTPSVLSELYRHLGFNATYAAKKRQIFFISHQIMMGIRGCMTAGETVRSIMVEYYPDKLDYFPKAWPADMFDRISEFWFMKMLRESLLSSVSPKPDEKPLGVIANDLVDLITGREDTDTNPFDLIDALPVIQINNYVESVFTKVVNEAQNQLILALKGDWKMVLRALTIPISDQVYVSRNQELMVHASFTLGKILREIIEDVNGQADIFKAMKPGLRHPQEFRKREMVIIGF